MTPVDPASWQLVVPARHGAGASRGSTHPLASRAPTSLRSPATAWLQPVRMPRGHVRVVTSDPSVAEAAAELGALVVPDPGQGLNAAVAAGLAAVPVSRTPRGGRSAIESRARGPARRRPCAQVTSPPRWRQRRHTSGRWCRTPTGPAPSCSRRAPASSTPPSAPGPRRGTNTRATTASSSTSPTCGPTSTTTAASQRPQSSGSARRRPPASRPRALRCRTCRPTSTRSTRAPVRAPPCSTTACRPSPRRLRAQRPSSSPPRPADQHRPRRGRPDRRAALDRRHRRRPADRLKQRAQPTS